MTWTDEKIEYLKTNHLKTNKELAHELFGSDAKHLLKKISLKRKSLGLLKRPAIKIDNEILIKEYVDNKKTCKDICREYGLSVSNSGNIGRRLKKLGIQIRKDAGENHHNWKGGKIIKGDNYIGTWCPEHERADSQGYVYEHTLVYEKERGILPKKGEVIHHIDIDKHNNSIENLYLCGNKEHIEIHRSIESLIKPLLAKGIIKFSDGVYKMCKED